MTDSRPITDNELIAIFMGWKQLGNPPTSSWADPEGKDIVQGRLFKAFERSWDWLMPVVEKIDKEFHAGNIPNQAWCDVAYALRRVDIKSVYGYVIIAIKTYNDQKIQPRKGD